MIDIFFVTHNNILLGGLTAIILVGIAVASAAASFFMSKTQQQNKTDMSPASIDQFGITQAREGQALPLVYGRIKLTGNIIWYGNLKSEEITEEQEGGKGGGKEEEVVTGYRYYLDIWQGLALGKVNVIKTYIQDEEQDITADNILFNDGTTDIYPSQPGSYANKIPGVAHVFYQGWYIGDNNTTVPVVRFVLERLLNTGINNENLSNGINPAAIIYDLLIRAGEDVASIDIDSFNISADFWNSRGYGLNIAFQKQEDVARLIQTVLGYVDGILFISQEGKFKLRALNPNDISQASLTENDYIRFKGKRVTYDEVNNSFQGTFTDQAQDYSQRTVTANNPAIKSMVQKTKQQSVDLAAFRDENTASKRLWEIMKQQSYPAMELEFTTNMVYSHLEPGDIVSINHNKYSISNADFRIISVNSLEIDKNEISFKAVQMVESLHDDNFLSSGGTVWEEEDTSLTEFTKTALFELPYNNSRTGYEPSFILLATRECGIETGFKVLLSNDGTDYQNKGIYTTFSQYGTLDQEYTIETYTIDDNIGILFTPYKDEPKFESISRANLFSLSRIAIINDEIIGFQLVIPEGENSFRLKECRRGMLGTPKQTHVSGSDIWLVNIGNNILNNINLEDFYVKLIPVFRTKQLDPSLVSSINMQVSYKARKPRRLSRIKAIRSGSNINIQIFPSTPGIKGASESGPGITDQSPPFLFIGDFLVSYDVTEDIKTEDNFDINYSGQINISIKHRLNGFLSDALIINVGISDGEYITS